MFFMAYSLASCAVDTDYWTGSATLDQEKTGGRYAVDLVLQLPAHGAGSVALHSALIDSPSTWLMPLRSGMK
jgi:hypothetical protein